MPSKSKPNNENNRKTLPFLSCCVIIAFLYIGMGAIGWDVAGYVLGFLVILFGIWKVWYKIPTGKIFNWWNTQPNSIHIGLITLFTGFGCFWVLAWFKGYSPSFELKMNKRK